MDTKDQPQPPQNVAETQHTITEVKISQEMQAVAAIIKERFTGQEPILVQKGETGPDSITTDQVLTTMQEINWEDKPAERMNQITGRRDDEDWFGWLNTHSDGLVVSLDIMQVPLTKSPGSDEAMSIKAHVSTNEDKWGYSHMTVNVGNSHFVWEKGSPSNK